MTVASRIQKWGNSLGLRFPKHLLDEAGLAVGDEVEIRVSESEIIVRPAKKRARKYRIEELVSRMPKDYQPEEVEWGKAEGREVW